MSQLHRPQRTVRKDPFPLVPYAEDDTSVTGDKVVGWVCAAAAILVLLGWLA